MSAADFHSSLKEKIAYKFWVREQARFTDLDALGHVSAVRVNEYFNAVRAFLFHRAIDKWPFADQLPVMKLSIVQHEREIKYPSELDVGLVIEKFGNTSFTAAAAIFHDDVCMALARNVFVFIDTHSRQPTRPHDYIRHNFLELTGPVREGS